jgi:hypothetical protein
MDVGLPDLRNDSSEIVFVGGNGCSVEAALGPGYIRLSNFRLLIACFSGGSRVYTMERGIGIECSNQSVQPQGNYVVR